MNFKSLLLSLFSLTLIAGCSGADSTVGTADTTPTQGNGNAMTPQAPAPQDGTVATRTEQAGVVSYRIYQQEPASAANRKGIVLLGAGNNEAAPSVGDLNGGPENDTANKLAKLGYVAAIVAYQGHEPNVDAKGDFNNDAWNRNSVRMGKDMSAVADAIIAKEGNGLSRDKVITGGYSYTGYMLLSNISSDASLVDTRGVLSACGATGDTSQQIPVFTVNCTPAPGATDMNGLFTGDGEFWGSKLINAIPAGVKADSGFFEDDSCHSHCGGDQALWTEKLIERVQLWLP